MDENVARKLQANYNEKISHAELSQSYSYVGYTLCFETVFDMHCVYLCYSGVFVADSSVLLNFNPNKFSN